MYKQINVEGNRITMIEIQLESGFKFVIGDRFNIFASTMSVDMAFDFFKNYAPLMRLCEVNFAWQCYQKAKKQKHFKVCDAFWKYFDGKRPQRVDRKVACWTWVDA